MLKLNVVSLRRSLLLAASIASCGVLYPAVTSAQPVPQAQQAPQTSDGIQAKANPLWSAEADAPGTGASDQGGLPSLRLDEEHGLTIRSGDSSLQLGIASQLRYRTSLEGEDEFFSEFTIPVVRPYARVKATPWLHMFLMTEFGSGDGLLLDWTVDVIASEAFAVKMGRFRTPYSRQYNVPIIDLLFTGRSVADAATREGREIGAMIYGVHGEGAFEYYWGVFNGEGQASTTTEDFGVQTIGRVAVNPLGPITYSEIPDMEAASPLRFGIGSSGIAGVRTQQGNPTDEQLYQWYGGAFDVALRAGGFVAQAEAYWRWNEQPRSNPDDADGEFEPRSSQYVQAGYLMTPVFAPGLRVSHVRRELDADLGHTDRYVGEAVVNSYFLGNRVKTQFELGVSTDKDEGSDATDPALSASLQLQTVF